MITLASWLFLLGLFVPPAVVLLGVLALLIGNAPTAVQHSTAGDLARAHR